MCMNRSQLHKNRVLFILMILAALIFSVAFVFDTSFQRTLTSMSSELKPSFSFDDALWNRPSTTFTWKVSQTQSFDDLWTTPATKKLHYNRYVYNEPVSNRTTSWTTTPQTSRSQAIVPTPAPTPVSALPVEPHRSTDLADYASSIRFENIEGSLTRQEQDEWKDFYGDLFSKFPTAFTDPLVYFRLRNSSTGSRGLAGSNIMIVRLGDVDKEEAAAVAIHELGHVVDLGLMKGSSYMPSSFKDGNRIIPVDDPSLGFYQISWRNEKDRRSNVREDYVSGYAMTDPFEDFAESFIYYVLHGEHFKMLAENNTTLARKYEFLQSKVFDGQEFTGLTEKTIGRYTSYRPWDATVQDYDFFAYQGRRFY